MFRTVLPVLFVSLGLLGVLLAEEPESKELPPAVAWHGRDYTPPRHYVCHRPVKPLKIDGKLDDEAWAAVPWSEPFVDIEGDRKPKPRFRTRMKMLWDQEYLYVAAMLDEPHVWGTLTKHDSVIFRDNDFEVFIDPDGDNHHYLEYEINALATDWDLSLNKPYKDGGKADNGWEIPGMKKAVHVDGTLNDASDTDRSWSVELAFPWKPIGKRAKVRVPPREGEQWRVNFSRVEWEHRVVDGEYKKVEGKAEDNWVWSPQWAINMHRPETWGYVQFSADAPGETEFVEDPTGLARHRLHRVLYAQKAFHRRSGQWADSLERLGLSDEGLTLKASKSGFSVRTSAKGGVELRLGDDGRLILKR